MDMQTSIEPVVKTLELNAPVEKAFHHFTANIHLWWPLARHSLSMENAQNVIFECKAGGRLYEIDNVGKEREWGRVLELDAPHRVVFSWVLEAPEKKTEVEVQFVARGEGVSTMTLIHSGWDTRPDGAEWRGKYNVGWDGVLGSYTESLS